jgi:hypothetical protein
VTSLFELDWDTIENLIEKTLDRLIRAYDAYVYMIEDSNHLLVKVYENNQQIFTIEFWFTSGRLEVTKAW